MPTQTEMTVVDISKVTHTVRSVDTADLQGAGR